MMITPIEYNYIFKIVLAGDAGVGKSTLAHRYCNNVYTDTYVGTLGVEFLIKHLHLTCNKVKLQIWDPSGQEKFRNIVYPYFKGAHGILLLFDLTKANPPSSLSKWLDSTKQCISPGCQIIIVGAKCDLLLPGSPAFNEIKQFAESHHLEYLETSSKKNINLDEVFLKLTQKIINVTPPKIETGSNLPETVGRSFCCSFC